MENAKVAIVIPVYNDEEYIRECLDSVLAQTVPWWEVWMCDDGSEDGSVSVAQEYCAADSRLHLLRNEVNSSAWVCRARGILAASDSVEYIMFADSDDSLQPNAVERAYTIMKAHPVDILNFGVNTVNHTEKDENTLANYDTMLQPKPTALKGYAVFENFVNSKFEGHLWSRMFSAPYLKEIINHLGADRYLPKAQDKALYWAACCFKKNVTYRGVSERLYNYNYGHGVEGAEHALTLKQFRQFVAMSDVEDLIADIMAESDFDPEKYGPVLEQSRYNLIHHNVKNFTRLRSTDQPEGLRMLREAWSKPTDSAMLVSCLAEYTWDQQIKYSEVIRRSGIFRTAKSGKDIKVVGTYYHRMDNGGIQQVIAKIADFWHSSGYEIVLFTDDEPTPDDYPLPDYVTRVNTGMLFSICDRNSYRTRCMNIARLLSEYNVDCMVYHSYFSQVLLYDMLLCKSMDVPFILYEHNVFSRFSRYADRRFSSVPFFARHCSALVCLDRISCEWWKMFNENSSVVTNPLTFKLEETSPAPRSSKNILFLCRLEEESKHPHDAISIMSIVSKRIPDAKLYIVGSGTDSMMSSMGNRITELGLQENVIMFGFHSEVAEFYNECSIFLSCSSHEGAPMTLCEAHSYSLPVVMYDLPYLAIAQGNEGIISVPQRDVDAAAEALTELLENPDEIISTGDRGRKYLENMYTVDIKAQWEQVFSSIEPEGEPQPAECSIAAILAADYSDGIDYLESISKDSRNKELERKLRNCSNQLNDIKNSISFKVGRAMTLVPRKLRDVMKK